MRVSTAIIPVAGYGTRLLPATKIIPKAMLPVAGKPIIDHLMHEVASSGIRHAVIVTGSGIGQEIIRRHFGKDAELEKVLRMSGNTERLRWLRRHDSEVRVTFVAQPKPEGNADAILRAYRTLTEREKRGAVAVLFGDDLIESPFPALKRMVKEFAREKCPMFAVERVQRSALSRYGAISGKLIRKNIWDVSRIIEKPHGKQMREVKPYAVIGRYILTPDTFLYIRREVRENIRDAWGDLSITDVLASYMLDKPVRAVVVGGTWHDCGTKDGYLRANVRYASLMKRFGH